MFDTNGQHLATIQQQPTTYQVWRMTAKRKTAQSKLILRTDDPSHAQAVAEAQMKANPTAYVYVKAWASMRSAVTWDSMSGWYVKGNPLDDIRRIVQP